MKWTSALAIYLLFWVMSAFFVMPFHARTSGEAGEPLVPGQAESAPHNFRPGRVAIWTTLVGTIGFALYYANYVYGWISAESLIPSL
jgi:predicted secreted protein